jgi:alkanesulfonate monooxygenase SsuD/methylene tetrahydromethanopterin reductase-like flavin-dependent oxidoreductase (luciferase family)
VDDLESHLDATAEAMLGHALSQAIVGSPRTVTTGLADFIARTGADELMITGSIYDHAARLRSFEIVAQANRALASETLAV